MMESLFQIFIFPGIAFLSAFGLIVEFVDRKLYARMQNRIGPPWFQPFADFIKLSSKKEIIPDEARPWLFRLMPVIAVTSAVVASFSIPIWSSKAIVSFQGDLIVVAYLLTIPTLTFFLGGWYSSSLFSTIGAVRTLTQLFAYEVPLFMAILAPALVAHTWCISEIAEFFSKHPGYLVWHIVAFGVSLVALQGKLERVPFDIPEAETEIVGGAFTEYSGKLLALFRLAIDVEMIVGASLIAAVFMPFGLSSGPYLGFIFYIVKVLFIVCILALMRSVMARIRIEQMVNFCWKYVAPLAMIQLIASIFIGSRT